MHMLVSLKNMWQWHVKCHNDKFHTSNQLKYIKAIEFQQVFLYSLSALLQKPQEFETWMTKCFLSTHLDPRQQVVLSHWLPCVVLPRYLALSSLLSFACFCRSSNFIPSEKRRGRIKCLVLVKHSEIATLLLPQLPHCLPTKALLDSDKER